MRTRIQRLIVHEWADALSQRLQKPVEQILGRGLNASDFSMRQVVEISFEDGSHARFLYAFFLRSEAKRRVAVFTEHCGYHEFFDGGLEIHEIDME